MWENSFANEIARLDKGLGTIMPLGNNKFSFIPKGLVSEGRTVIYRRIVAEIGPQKSETHRTHFTVKIYIINFPGYFNTPTEDLTTAKLIINSVL